MGPGDSRLLLGCAVALFAAAAAISGAEQSTRKDIRSFIRPPDGIQQSDPVFQNGRTLFGKRWTPNEGLGPLYDGRSCLICHPRGGNGRPVEQGRTGAENASAILRIAAPGNPYGRQLQRRTYDDAPGEGQFETKWQESDVTFPDGETVSLRRPRYVVSNLAHGAIPDTFSVLVAPKIAGTGLLEAIYESEIRHGADPNDRDGDGISGRASITADGQLGRFGWRAEVPSVADQVARAFAQDMGLSTALYPDVGGDCISAACRARFGKQTARAEVSAEQFVQLLAFVRMVDPPSPGSLDALGTSGKMLFASSGCAACHRPSFITGEANDAWLSRREIWPYTDLLLHDMGPGLADGLGDEWRTAPLWSVALRGQVHGDEFYLHDGRARSLTEAILWHGGEAQAARDRFAALSARDRAALLAFLRTL